MQQSQAAMHTAYLLLTGLVCQLLGLLFRAIVSLSGLFILIFILVIVVVVIVIIILISIVSCFIVCFLQCDSTPMSQLYAAPSSHHHAVIWVTDAEATLKSSFVAILCWRQSQMSEWRSQRLSEAVIAPHAGTVWLLHRASL